MNVASSIISIRELIDTAFGDPSINVVNHKLIHTVLVILARQLRLLERRVEVEIGQNHFQPSDTSLSITEVKLNANIISRKIKGNPEVSTPTKKGLHVSKLKGAKIYEGESEKPFASKTKDNSINEKSTSNKSSTEKSLAAITSSTLKSTTENSTKGGKYSANKTSGENLSLAKDSSLTQGYEEILQTIEEQRERELRTIHQRADSREEPGKAPTPMASLNSIEKHYEKLLIVERVPTETAQRRSQIDGTQDNIPRLSVVTQTEFEELASIVYQLQDKFTSVGTAIFPENAQLMDDLRKGASLTDAMAALQLSARVEAAERALEKMMSVVTDLANNKTGTDVEAMPAKTQAVDAIKVEGKNILGISSKKFVSKSIPKESGIMPDKQIDETSDVLELVFTETKEPKEESPNKFITYDELDNLMQEIHNEFSKMIETTTDRSNIYANNALIIANRMEGKLNKTLNLGDRMNDLEKLVSDYADQINTLDTGLSSQMTNYQDQLTQMQHDLESGLETMAEALANTGGDTAAVAELNHHFTSLQEDIDTASMKQKELSDIQKALSLNLQTLWKQIEILRDTKSDRDEVADAFKDKAGLAALNGMVSRQEFDAVRGDFEKQIGAAYNKFNNQEFVWQKAIDELLRELSEKADLKQLVTLQESINQYLEKLKGRIKEMEDVVGEPRAAAITRKLHREAECLSCATPAYMKLEAVTGPPALPGLPSKRPPAVEAKAEKIGEDGDHRICYPGHPIAHAVDPRAHICHRYCGGSHTLLNKTMSRVPPGMIINSLTKNHNNIGTDEKYNGDENIFQRPCLPCNVKQVPQSVLKPSEVVIEPNPGEMEAIITPPDFQPSLQTDSAEGEVSITPPPPIDDD